MKALRTPDERFKNLPGYHFAPHYVEIPDGEGGTLRMHYVDEGPRDGNVVWLMHGEPSWSYVWRKLIPIIAKAGYRVIAPDLIGFGKSDKPDNRNNYSYQRHIDWMFALADKLHLKGITMVCHDWGGMIALRMVAAKPHLFDRVVTTNTGLATGENTPKNFLEWMKYSQEVPVLDVGFIVKMSGNYFKPERGLPVPPDDVIAAYDAPYPDESYKEGVRMFPTLVPITPDDPEAVANRQAWDVLSTFTKPFLTAYSDGDDIMGEGYRIFQKKVPGCQGQPHTIIKDAGHFLQEDKGEELAAVVVEFIARTRA